MRKIGDQAYFCDGRRLFIGQGPDRSSLGGSCSRPARGHAEVRSLHQCRPRAQWNPFQHGEVFVTEDGAETDSGYWPLRALLDVNLSGAANDHRPGVFHGHFQGASRRIPATRSVLFLISPTKSRTSCVVRLSLDENGERPDVIITEIGGTVGDIECSRSL